MATQTLTIMLADLVGSTAHLTTVPQKQAVEYLQDAIEPICAAIKEHGGTVVKFTGDGYLATFECVGHALRAAEDIRHHFLRQKHTPTGISLDGVRVILNTADVTVQNDDVYGDGVALVARLEKDVPANQVYVTPAVYAIADDAEFSFDLAGELRPRGWHRVIKVYQLQPTEANFVDEDVFLLITDLHGLIHAGESLTASDMNRWLLKWGDMHRQSVVGIKGRVRQFVADMALLTFSTADEAVQGVLNLRALANEHNRTQSDLPPIRFAAAIACGDLILSPTGVVGPVVTRTFRLLNASPREAITISERVYRALSAHCDRFCAVTRTIDRETQINGYELQEL